MAKKQVAVDEPAKFELHQAQAIQAWMRGTATKEQQQISALWVVARLCQTNRGTFRNDPYEHAFMAGRRFPGLQLKRMEAMTLAEMQREAVPPQSDRKTNG